MGFRGFGVWTGLRVWGLEGLGFRVGVWRGLGLGFGFWRVRLGFGVGGFGYPLRQKVETIGVMESCVSSQALVYPRAGTTVC